MAKKKATHHPKPPKEDPDLPATTPAAAMDKENGADSDRLDNLKSLNDILVKETSQRRQQVASLLKSKESLESELSRAHMDNAALQAELAGLHDGVARMDLESGVVSLFVGTQLNQQAEVIAKEKMESDEEIRNAAMELGKTLKEKAAIEEEKREKQVCIESLEKEMKRFTDEIDNERVKLKRIYAERDSIIAELDVQIEETNGLKLKLSQSEKFGEETFKGFEKLNVKINGLEKEREDRERLMEAMEMQKTDLDRALQTKNLEMEKLKMETEEITRLKEKAEDDRNEELKKNNKLQRIGDELNLELLSLKEKETQFHGKIEGLERWRIEATEKEEELSLAIEVLIKEKMENENRIEVLTEENGDIKKNLQDAIKEIDGKNRDLEELVNSKVKIDNEKADKEKEVIELMKELSEIRIAMSAMEESLKAAVEKNKQFQSEVEQNKEVINKITKERNEAIKGLNDEKLEGNNLMSRIETMEKEIEETKKLMEKMIAEKNSLLGERDDARKWLKNEKDRSNNLMSRISAMEKEIEEIQKLMEKIITEKKNLLGELDDARKGLADEKEQCKVLMSKISTMQIEIQEIMKLMEKMTEEKKNLSGERGNLEANCKTLQEEIASLQFSLKKANEQTVSMKAEIESVVGLLKNTRALVCRNGIEEEDDAEYEVELETIKNAFKNREEKVEDMKRELEVLQNSMEEANKKKSFWAFLSSATTICFAAISVAYVAKGH